MVSVCVGCRFTEFLSGRDHVSAEEKGEHEWSFVHEESDSDTVDYEEEEITHSPHRSAGLLVTHMYTWSGLVSWSCT